LKQYNSTENLVIFFIEVCKLKVDLKVRVTHVSSKLNESRLLTFEIFRWREVAFGWNAAFLRRE